MSSSWVKRISAGVVLFAIATGSARCQEAYYINDERVLLYKVINWWYDSLSGDAGLLCGNRIRCQARGNILIRHDPDAMTLTLDTKEPFADLLSVVRPCQGCTYLKLIWINTNYFGTDARMDSSAFTGSINAIVFRQVDKNHAKWIQQIEPDMGLSIQGAICGLMDGRIALHHSGQQLKTCQADNGSGEIITLDIINYQTHEIMARFAVDPS